MFRKSNFNNSQTKAVFEELTEQKVEEIKLEYKNGATKRALQKKYKLSRYYIDKILHNEVEF